MFRRPARLLVVRVHDMYTRSVPKMYSGLLGMFRRRARLLVVPSAICTLGVFRRCTQDCCECL